MSVLKQFPFLDEEDLDAARIVARTSSASDRYQLFCDASQKGMVRLLELVGGPLQDLASFYFTFEGGAPLAVGCARAVSPFGNRYIVTEESSGLMGHPPWVWNKESIHQPTAVILRPSAGSGPRGLDAALVAAVMDHCRPRSIWWVSPYPADGLAPQTTLDQFDGPCGIGFGFLSVSPEIVRTLEGSRSFASYAGQIALERRNFLYRLKTDLDILHDTELRRADITNAIVCRALQLRAREDFADEDKYSWSTHTWLSFFIRWLQCEAGPPIEEPTNRRMRKLLWSLVDGRIAETISRTWRGGRALVYVPGPALSEVTSKVYLPLLSDEGLLEPVDEAFSLLVEKRPQQIEADIHNRANRPASTASG